MDRWNEYIYLDHVSKMIHIKTIYKPKYTGAPKPRQIDTMVSFVERGLPQVNEDLICGVYILKSKSNKLRRYYPLGQNSQKINRIPVRSLYYSLTLIARQSIANFAKTAKKISAS